MNRIPQEQGQGAALVLVIEDDAVQRRGLCRLLEREGFQCTGTSSAQEALDYILDENVRSPELIVSDLRLPERNGLEVLEAIRLEGIATPFLLMTAYYTEDLERTARASGAFQVFEKPFENDALLVSCRQAMNEDVR